MASNTAPVVDRIRIIPRPDDFLDRNVGNSGEVFFDKEANTLRLYSGNLAGGYTVLTTDNISEKITESGVATVEYSVTVGVDPDGLEVGNKYFIDTQYKPELTFVVGYTYIFNQDDQTNEYFPNPEGGTNNQHPLNFSADNLNGELAGGTAYLTNVVYRLENEPVTKDDYWNKFSVSTQRSVQITITSSTPKTLYYWCQQHTNMGNSISIAEPGSGSGGAAVVVDDLAPASPVHGDIWYNSTNGILYVYVQDADSSQWIQPSVPFPEITSILDLGISDGTNGQVLTTNGSGGFSFQTVAAGSDIGNFTLGSSTIDTDDSSGITIVPSVTLNSDLNIQNDLRVTNTSYANQFVTTGTGSPLLNSASTITLSAPDGVIVNNGPFRLPNLTDAQRDALAAINGDMIYNTTSNRPEMYINGAWRIIDNSPIV